MILNHCFKIQRFVLAAVLAIGTSFVPSAFADYFIIDANNKTWTPLDSYRAVIVDMNNAGQVTGYWASPYTGIIVSWLTGPNGGQVAISGLGWQDYPRAINNAGQVAGRYYESVGGDDSFPDIGPPHAFITGPDGVGWSDLGTLGGDGSRAANINDAGQVVGGSQTPTGYWHAFVTDPDEMGMRDLGTLGGDESYAGDINDIGQVVGWSETDEGTQHAFITGPHGMGMRDLRTLGGIESRASEINDIGQVVGTSSTAEGLSHAFITGPDGMGMRDLGTLGGIESRAFDINDAGQVVGVSETAEGTEHAFITGPNGEGMTDLSLLVDIPYHERFFITRPIAINDHGQVLVYGVGVPPIPEPETYTLMLAGLGLIGFMARYKKAKSPIKRC